MTVFPTRCSEQEIAQKIDNYHLAMQMRNVDSLSDISLEKDITDLVKHYQDTCTYELVDYEKCPDSYSFLQKFFNKCKEIKDFK